MKYIGSRLSKYLKGRRGAYTDLSRAMVKYRKPRENSGRDEYNLAPFFRDGHNITLDLLTGLIRETGQPIDFFVDFEPGELPPGRSDGVSGNNNIINSHVTTDLTTKVDHLNEIIRLKDELISDKERIITLKDAEIEKKDAEIEQWKKRYDNLAGLAQFGDSDNNQTQKRH